MSAGVISASCTPPPISPPPSLPLQLLSMRPLLLLKGENIVNCRVDIEPDLNSIFVHICALSMTLIQLIGSSFHPSHFSFLFHSHGHLNFSFKIVSGRPSSGEMVCGKADKIGGGSSGGRLRGLLLLGPKSSVLKVN